MYFSSFVFLSKSYIHTHLNVTHCTSISKFILCANYLSSSVYTLDVYWCANTHIRKHSHWTTNDFSATFPKELLHVFHAASTISDPNTFFFFDLMLFFFLYILFSCSFSPLINNWGTPVICFAVSCRNCIDVFFSTLFKQQSSHL